METQAELYTLYPGDRLDLDCPAKDSLQLVVNWTKDHAALTDDEHTRIRNGQLEIEKVDPTDSGLYACTTFGNHTVFFNVSGKRHPAPVMDAMLAARAAPLGSKTMIAIILANIIFAIDCNYQFNLYSVAPTVYIGNNGFIAL